jgi:hypothetical protein
VRINSLDELQMPDYDVMAEEAGKAQKMLFPQLGKSPESERDVDSPFENSND